MKKFSPAFSPSDVVFYPSHGVGTIVSQEIVTVEDASIDMYVVNLPAHHATLRVPVADAIANGMTLVSSLINDQTIEKVWQTLAAPATGAKKHWQKREADFKAKIRYGDALTLAAVVRDCISQNEGGKNSFAVATLRGKAARLLAELFAHENNLSQEAAQEEINRHLQANDQPVILFWNT